MVHRRRSTIDVSEYSDTGALSQHAAAADAADAAHAESPAQGVREDPHQECEGAGLAPVCQEPDISAGG